MPVKLEDRLIHRWLWLALPEDCAQEVAMVDLQYPSLTPSARREMISFRLRKLRHEVWDRELTRSPRAPEGLRPSKLTTRAGYRTSGERHSAARMTLTAVRRSEIARKAASARWRKEEQ